MPSREEESLKKATGSRREKARAKSNKDKDKGKAKVAKVSKVPKAKIKAENDPKAQKSGDVVKIKKESMPAEPPKEKDGESLLDLLELEMRARAIRALIRKEEDIIPANPSSSTSENANQNLGSKTRQKNRQLSLKVVQDKLQELDTSFNRNLAKVTQEMGEEEDVVLVLEPTTTIELLSSESEGEGAQAKRRNQKFQNERIVEKGEGEETEKGKGVKAVADQIETAAPTESNSKTGTEKSIESGEKATEEEKNAESLRTESKKDEEASKAEENIVESQETEPIKATESKGEIGETDEDKSTDLEIVIDLDDYPDDMENLETSEKKKKKKLTIESLILNTEKKLDIVKEDETSAETWATRYYQTEDVQSVIKESKIQSEIRKRLRERQRLARLNNSPGLNASQSSAPTVTAEKGVAEKEDSPTTGSVEEYMALKNVEAVVLAVDEKEKEPVESVELEKTSEPVVPTAEIETEEKKVAKDGLKEAELVHEAKEDGEIIDKVE